MKRTFSTELLDDKEVTTVADLDFNEVKLQGVILEVEQALLSIRLRRVSVIRQEQEKQKLVQQKSEPSAEASESWFQSIKKFFSRG